MEEKPKKKYLSQARARDKWDAAHPENKKRRCYKSGCKSYILTQNLSKAEMDEVKGWIAIAEENQKNAKLG